jgi:hypothetical protein
VPLYPPQMLHKPSCNWKSLHRLQPANDQPNHMIAELFHNMLKHVIAGSPADWKTSRSLNIDSRVQMDSFMHQILWLVLNTINLTFKQWYHSDGNRICGKPCVGLCMSEYNSHHQTFPLHILYPILHTENNVSHFLHIWYLQYKVYFHCLRIIDAYYMLRSCGPCLYL